MNVFARNRNTYPPFSHARKELEKEHFIFSLNEQLSNVANGKNGEGKNHNFLRKKKIKKIYHLGRNFIYFESRFNYQSERWRSVSCNHHRVLWNVSSRAENDRARSKRSKTRGLSRPYLARPVLTNPQWRLWTLVRPRDWQWPLLSGAGLPSGPPLSKKRAWKRAENPPQSASVDDLRSRESFVATSSQSFFFILSLFFFLSLPRQQPAPPRAIMREATSKFFANGPLMARGYTRVVFSNEPVGVSSLITRITSTGKPSVRTRETTPFPSSISRPLRILRHSRWLAR